MTTPEAPTQVPGALEMPLADPNCLHLLAGRPNRYPDLRRCTTCEQRHEPGMDVLLAFDATFCSFSCRSLYVKHQLREKAR